METFAFVQTALSHGLSAPELGLTAARAATGVFFATSGYNKLFDKQRHATLRATLQSDGVPFVRFNQWWVPGWEFFGGIALTLGVFAGLAASALFVLICVAALSEARKRVAEYHPINREDVICDYLYLPEIIYALVLATLLVGGMGYVLV